MIKKTTAEQEVSLGFHVFFFIVNLFSCQHWMSSRNEWFTFARYGGQLKYMSHLLLYFNTFYCAYAVLVDVFCIATGYTSKPAEVAEKEDSRPMLMKVRDELFNSLKFPFGFCHTAAYLLLTTYDNSLFVSSINRRKETLYSYNMLYLHFFPIIVCILESIVVYHKHNRDLKKSLKITGLVSVLYVIWLLLVAYFGKYWSYPFLRRVPSVIKTLCLAAYPLLNVGSYFVGRKMTNQFWTSDIAKAKEQ